MISASAVVLLGVLAAGCANRPLTASPRAATPPCTPPPVASHITLVTESHNPRLVASCFAVPANTAFQIILKNNTTAESDGTPVPVQFAIFSSRAAAVTFDPSDSSYNVHTSDAFFVSDVDQQGDVTDTVTGLSAGTYYVLDVMHPAYQGAGASLIVQ
jgi:hypothetical protein